jgi:parvulin-like peptidyl-prolyl isomerase
MSSPGKSALPLAVLGAAFVYLAGDLLVFHGPVFRTIDRYRTPQTDIAARVSGQPITRSQLDRTVSEALWLQGKSPGSVTSAELAIARKAALEELIDHELLRLQVKADQARLSVTDEEINERLRRLVGRFESKGVLETAMKSQGIATEQNLRDRLAARIRQEKLIETRIGPSIKVSDAEAREWFDENQKTISLPERIEVRHIFLPALDHPPEEAKQKLDAALADLVAKKKDFATLAREISEDPATKDSGGGLGWMTRDRLPADFGAPVFSLPVNQPTLLRTRLGWHLVEVTGRKPAEPRTFEQAKPEIISALEAIKRRKAIEDFRKSLRQKDASKIEILKSTDTP